MSKTTIYEQLKAAGVELDHHESDLYAKVTPESRAIVDAYDHRYNVKTFKADDGSGAWFDIPFAFDPFWKSHIWPTGAVWIANNHHLYRQNRYRYNYARQAWQFDDGVGPWTNCASPMVTMSPQDGAEYLHSIGFREQE